MDSCLTDRESIISHQIQRINKMVTSTLKLFSLSHDTLQVAYSNYCLYSLIFFSDVTWNLKHHILIQALSDRYFYFALMHVGQVTLIIFPDVFRYIIVIINLLCCSEQSVKLLKQFSRHSLSILRQILSYDSRIISTFISIILTQLCEEKVLIEALYGLLIVNLNLQSCKYCLSLGDELLCCICNYRNDL
ncbi:hypothetical protein FGO68_gene8699 [Halteria grandinella]|uniref:Uncharacterized protein n=1 Tax=Halteria grandinella TaxID=5974 RepID=A0A8J8NVU0_HALGN|nr:hypothetical protein FGO68_gene8699 [Halteria grandinella]